MTKPGSRGKRVQDLTDGTVLLRAWAGTDATAVSRASHDPEIRAFTSVPPEMTRPRAAAWAERLRSDTDAGTQHMLAITLTGSPGECVGGCGIVRYKQGRGEVAYWLLPETRGKSFASRALRLLTRYALDPDGPLALPRLDLFTDLPNEASRQVAVAAGFRPEATLRAWRVSAHGTRDDVMLHGIVPADLTRTRTSTDPDVHQPDQSDRPPAA